MGLRSGARSALCACAIAVAGCASDGVPVLASLHQLESRRPLVLVPGITGSRLEDVETGEVAWGDFRSLLFPRDGGYELALPLGDGEDRIDAVAPILGIDVLGLHEVDFYGEILELLEANGYRRGDLERPDATSTLYVFPYDWRRGSDLAAAELAASLEALRAARGEEVLEVDLLCHSNAARVARYLLKYGGGTLEQAERGEARPPPNIRVARLVLVATANGGGLGVLSDLLAGRRFLPLIGRHFRPEVLFTFPAAFEELPVYARRPFDDEQGRPIDADLFDAATWERFRWSVFAPEAAARLERRGRVDLFGDLAARRQHLERTLRRAERLAVLLHRDAPGFAGTRYYSIQNAYEPTPERAVIGRDGRIVWPRPGDRRAGSDKLAPGDGFATLASQGWLSPQESAAFAAPPFYVPARHRAIFFTDAAQRRILEILAADR